MTQAWRLTISLTGREESIQEILSSIAQVVKDGDWGNSILHTSCAGGGGGDPIGFSRSVSLEIPDAPLTPSEIRKLRKMI